MLQTKISRLGHGELVVACASNACGGVERDGYFGISVSEYSIWDIRETASTLRFWERYGTGDIPQTTKDLEFGRKDINKGLETGIYQEVSKDHANIAMRNGALISLEFLVWQEKEEERRGRFVVNISQQSTHWEKDSVRMETLPKFSMSVQKED